MVPPNESRIEGEPDSLLEAPGEAPQEAFSFLEPPGRPDSLGRLGHYEVLEVLGEGGFGIVLRALDVTLQRIVAVKVLNPQMAGTSPARNRFLREARSSAQVRHDNVVQVHAVEEQPLPYLVMELVPGETLQDRIDRDGPLEVSEVLRIGRQIAEGLAAAHATGLIHRDVKPANVLLDRGPEGQVKLTDFGLARAADDASVSQSGLVAGTPMYMSPEQARGEHLDHRTDLFSLGSLLYAMTSGRPPFQADNTLAILRRVNEDTPRPLQDVNPEIPTSLCDIIARLQAKDAADRFQSAQEVADLLKSLQQNGVRPLQSQRVGPHFVAGSKRRRSVGIAVAAVLLLFAGLIVTEATGVTQLRGTIAGLFSSEETAASAADAKSDSPQKSNDKPAADVGKANDTPNQVRNPFKLKDVVGFDDQEVVDFARAVKLAGDARDVNAEQWAREAADGNKGSLDGTWYSRWEFVAGGGWTYAAAQIKVIGDRVYILHTDKSGTYLMEAVRAGKRLVGRYVNVHNSADTSPVVAEIVDDERIDGRWMRGRWDFRRKLPVEKK